MDRCLIEKDLRILGHDQLDDSLTCLVTSSDTVHRDIDGSSSRWVELDSSRRALCQTRIGHLDALAQFIPFDLSSSERPSESDEVVNAPPSSHETVAEIRVLVECKVLAAKVEEILVFTFGKRLL